MHQRLKTYWLNQLGRLVVWLHYRKELDIYALCSIHAPRKYKKKRRIPDNVRWAVWHRDNFTCVYCFSCSGPMTLDHIIPEVRNGTETEDNLVTCCQSCNNKKADNSVQTFLKENIKWIEKKRQRNLQSLSTTQGKRVPIGAALLLSPTGSSS